MYVGPAGKPKTERRTLQVKLEYLQGLQEEITVTIRQVQEQLAELPPEKEKKQSCLFYEITEYILGLLALRAPLFPQRL